MNWSKYQQAIFTAVAQTQDSLLVSAVAGSGKTTTIVEAIKHVPQDKSVLFCAFNKAIADTLKSRITSPNATCATLHSLGLRAWQSFTGGGVQVEGRKAWELLKEIEPRWDRRKQLGQVVKLVGLAKQHGIMPQGVLRLPGAFLAPDPHPRATASPYRTPEGKAGGSVALADLPETQNGCAVQGLVADTDETWIGLCDTYGIDSEEVDLGVARELLRQSLLTAREQVDYDDMLYLPIVTEAPFNQYDVVFVDEVQDLNGIQIEMVSRMCKGGAYAGGVADLKPPNTNTTNELGVSIDKGRVIAVGDPAQSIYRFRGAHAEAMAELASRFHCQPLPLSISYRCPRAVVRKAQSWVSVIEASQEAQEGLVAEPNEWMLADFRPEDVILCRLTRPLVATAFRLIRARVPCRVLGRDIGQGLLKLIDKSKIADDLPTFRLLDWLDGYERQESESLKRKQEWAKIGLLHDKCETLRIFAADRDQVLLVRHIRQEIESLFQDNGSGLTLSTIHKYKGQEAPRVFVLDADELQPVPWSTDLEQEKNLMYVAATRAMRELYYVRSKDLH